MNYDLGYLPHCEGAWNDYTAYDPMAIVTNYGVAYISKVAVSAGAYEPGEAAGWGNYWQILAEGVQGATGAQGTQGPAGGGSGELAMKGKPGLLSVQGNVESAMFSAEHSPHAMTVPIWFDRKFKTHVVDVLNMKPVLEAIGFRGSQGAQGSTGSRGAQGYTGAEANVIELTQAEYDALEEKDANTIYIITDAVGPQGTQGPAGMGIFMKEMSAGGSDKCDVEMKPNVLFDLKETDSMTTLNITWDANEQFLSNPGQVRFVAIKDVNLIVSIRGGEAGELVYRTGVEGFENGTFKQGYTYVVTILGDMIDIESFKKQ